MDPAFFCMIHSKKARREKKIRSGVGPFDFKKGK